MSWQDIEIDSLKGLALDSREVRPGYLFAALPGSASNGNDYIQSAVEKGASVILAAEGAPPPAGTQLVTDPNPRRALALLAAKFYGAQPENCVAVTGTNGKSSIVHFTQQIWRAANHKAASIGTLTHKLTTPDQITLAAELAELNKSGVTHLALEASSHGLDQCRLDGVQLKSAAFTNLSHDHLDYHADMKDYLASKKRLFAELLPEGARAVLNADVQEFDELNALCRARGHKILSYGWKGEDFKILEATPLQNGQKLKLRILGAEHEVQLPLVGEFQAMNALCALALSGELENINVLEKLEGAPGRLQQVPGHAIYIDYAHTSAALEHVLKAMRPYTKGRLLCLFGCGGDRDNAKRPLMGRIAAAYADHVIVTDDNPRSEDSAAIRTQIMAGAPGAKNIEGRRAAIRAAVQGLQDGDVLIIAGKGHEQGQIFADHTDPFDDFEEAKKATKELA